MLGTFWGFVNAGCLLFLVEMCGCNFLISIISSSFGIKSVKLADFDLLNFLFKF